MIKAGQREVCIPLQSWESLGPEMFGRGQDPGRVYHTSRNFDQRRRHYEVCFMLSDLIIHRPMVHRDGPLEKVSNNMR